jgi:hypothetical protein
MYVGSAYLHAIYVQPYDTHLYLLEADSRERILDEGQPSLDLYVICSEEVRRQDCRCTQACDQRYWLYMPHQEYRERPPNRRPWRCMPHQVTNKNALGGLWSR